MSDIKTPYLNGHMYEFDLCWLVEKILSFESQLNQAIDLKTIHYADPIQWDITTQYAPNTVVVDPKTGTAYMSKVPVPAGILLTNADYWTVIFNYQDIYTKIMEGVAFYNGQSDYASKALLVNDLLWYGLDLYRVTKPIEEGGKLIPETNLVKTSIESLLSNYYGRDRVTTLLNDTLNVSGGYTINAGDIAETSANRTIKVTADREIDIDGNDSVHIDGVSTLNVGGLRTEAYAGDRTENVIGTYTGKFGAASFETGASNWKIKFPDITTDLSQIPGFAYLTPETYGAKGDGISDDTSAFQAAINSLPINGGGLILANKTYICKGELTVPSNLMIIGQSSYATILEYHGNSLFLNQTGGDVLGFQNVFVKGAQSSYGICTENAICFSAHNNSISINCDFWYWYTVSEWKGGFYHKHIGSKFRYNKNLFLNYDQNNFTFIGCSLSIFETGISIARGEGPLSFIGSSIEWFAKNAIQSVQGRSVAVNITDCYIEESPTTSCPKGINNDSGKFDSGTLIYSSGSDQYSINVTGSTIFLDGIFRILWRDETNAGVNLLTHGNTLIARGTSKLNIAYVVGGSATSTVEAFDTVVGELPDGINKYITGYDNNQNGYKILNPITHKFL